MPKSTRTVPRRKRAISAIAQRRLPFGPAHEAQDEPYDAADDFEASINACYAAIRERVAAGGGGWAPK